MQSTIVFIQPSHSEGDSAEREVWRSPEGVQRDFRGAQMGVEGWERSWKDFWVVWGGGLEVFWGDLEGFGRSLTVFL